MEQWAKKAALVRKWCLLSTTEAGSGHPTSCMSAADIATVLFDTYFTYDIKTPHHSNNDRFVLSKGHAAPLYYTLFALSGAFAPEELLTLRKFTSRLEGHPTSEFVYAEAATGSLGQGLSIGCGIALSAKKTNHTYKTFVLLGDGEMAEGSVWEAANFASYYKLDNLIALVDVNRLGQSQETMFGHRTQEYVHRLEAFGWETVEIEGHNFEQIDLALQRATSSTSGKPFAIVAKTKKGKGVSFLEDKDSWHGKAVKKEEVQRAIEELGEIDDSLRFSLRIPQVSNQSQVPQDKKEAILNIVYKKGEEVATREVYGEILAQIGNTNPLIFALDGDVKNSTFSQDFKKVHEDRFVECFIAEQNMVGVALGLCKRDKVPFVSTFAAFLTRAADQIRMAAVSKGNIKFVGSHCGVSIGEDGISQMGLEDIALFGAMADCVIMHPSDAVSAAKLIPLLATHIGISYLRTLRPKTPVLYDISEEFIIGGSKVLQQSENDLLTIAACGITVHEALKAYEELKKENIFVKVVDCYCVRPIDKETLVSSVQKTKKPIVVSVEDHYSHGGFGDFVQSGLSETGAHVIKMAVEKLAHSGTKDELLSYVEIDSGHIAQKVRFLNK